MELKEIKQLITLMNENELLEMEIVEEGRKIRLKKMYEPVRKEVIAIPTGQIAQAAPVVNGLSQNQQIEAAAENSLDVVKSPMPGTFYRSPDPSADPFVEIGSEVTPDTTVCYIESMKVFNEIKAEVTGIVKDILVEEGDAVEFGTPMIVIKPTE